MFSFPHRSAAAVLAFALLAGCEKPASPTAAPAPQPTPAPAPVEKTSFEAVAKHLDTGGGLYGYLSTESFFRMAAEFAGKMKATAEADLNLTPEQKQRGEAVWQAVRTLVNESGLREISGAGMSSIAIRPGYYRMRAILHHYPEQGRGFLWHLHGGQATALDWVNWLPEKTTAAGSFDLTLEPLREALAKAFASDEALRPQWEQMEAQVKAATGLELRQILSGLGPVYGYVLVLDPATPFTIPRQTPHGEPMTIPEPRLALMLQLRDEALLQWVRERLAQIPGQPATTEEEGWTVQRIAIPIPLPFLSPVVAWKGDRVLIASNEPLFREMLAVHAGKQPGLAATAAFKQAMEGLPTSGTSFGYVTPEFHDAIAAIQMQSLKGNGPNQPGAAMMRVIQETFQARQLQASVGQTTPEGWITVTNGGLSPAQAVTVTTMVPVALVAAAVVPTLQASKRVASSVTAPGSAPARAVLDQLRLLDAGLDQWAIENSKPSGSQPTTDDVKLYFKPGTPLHQLLEAHPGATAVPLVPGAPPVVLPPVGGNLTLPPEAQAMFGPLPPSFWGPFSGAQ